MADVVQRKKFRIVKMHPGHVDVRKIEQINNEAFPPIERMEVAGMFLFMTKTDSDLFGIYEGNDLVGFAFLVKNEICAYLFFFAIDEALRGQGYGSGALDAILRAYPERQIVLDFEELDKIADNYAQRMRRKAFYLRNGFHETGYGTVMRGVRFEAVCNGGPLDKDAFLDLVGQIHENFPVFENKLININKQ